MVVTIVLKQYKTNAKASLITLREESGRKRCHSRSSLCANLLENCCPVELESNCAIDQQRPGLEPMMKCLPVILSRQQQDQHLGERRSSSAAFTTSTRLKQFSKYVSFSYV